MKAPITDKWAPKLAILDLETGGLDPRITDIVEYAVLVPHHFDRAFDDLIAAGRVWPELPVEPKAGEVNGFNIAGWAGAASQRHALQVLCHQLEGKYVAGSNPQFDWGYVVEGCRRHGLRPPKLASRHLLDVPSMAHPLMIAGHIPNLKQSTLMEYFELGEQKHGAVEDVQALAAIYRRLLPMFEVPVIYETEARPAPYKGEDDASS